MYFPNVPDVPGVPSLPRNLVSNIVQGSINGAVLSVTNVLAGAVNIGQSLSDLRGLISPGTFITGAISGSGGIGSYALNTAQSLLNSQINISSFTNSVPFLTQDNISGFSQQDNPQWGLYLDNDMVVSADTVTSFTFSQEWQVSDYPVENGAFQSYNKVILPQEITIDFTSGGSESNRENLLVSIRNIAGNLVLYDVVTPEDTYIGVTINRYDYRRTAVNGVGMITVTVHCTQVIETATMQFTQSDAAPVSPAPGAPAVNAGPATSVATAGSVLSNFSTSAANLDFSNPLQPFSKSAINAGVVQAITVTATNIAGTLTPITSAVFN